MRLQQSMMLSFSPKETPVVTRMLKNETIQVTKLTCGINPQHSGLFSPGHGTGLRLLRCLLRGRGESARQG
jgi:hypothetical protein